MPSAPSKAQATSEPGPAFEAATPGRMSTPAPTTAPAYSATACGSVIDFTNPAVVPTPTGALLLRHADAIVARVKAAQADVEAVTEGAAGTLRIGTYQSVGKRILPAVLPAFAESWPHVEIELRESASDYDLLGLVERAELDLTFCMLPVEEGPFASRELARDGYRLVVAAGSPVATGAAMPSLREIAALPLLGFRSCRNEHRVDAHLRAQGLEPNVVFRSDDNG